MRVTNIKGIAAGLILAAASATANAQYGYPGGYGGYGWGGWGGNSAAAGRGAEAAGLGNMAAGMGSYNVQTAQARAINTQTAMQYNEYMYQSLMVYDQKLYAQQQKEIQDYKTASKMTEDRLRNHPTPNDIYNGDALNIALTELSDPSYSQKVWQLASQVKVSGKLIQNIPFYDAAGAVTATIDRITHADPKGVLATSTFASDVAAYRKVCEQLNKQIDEKGDVKSETVKQLRQVVQAAIDKLQSLESVDQTQKNQAEMHLKTLMGLTYVLDGPSLDIFMAGVGDMKEVSLDRLLSFMRSFNLRFGPAKDPNQKQVYDTLYPMLVGVRDQMFGNGQGTLPSSVQQPPNPQSAYNFYAGMHVNDLHPDKDRTIPPAPAPGGQ